MSNFKNEYTQRFVELLDETKALANKKRKGEAWRAIYFGVAALFPEDKVKLFNALADEAKTSKRNIPTGGATVTRPGPASTTVTRACKDCPDSAMIVSENVKVRTFKMGEGSETGEAGPPEVENPDTISVDAGAGEPEVPVEPVFSSPEDVMERFEGDPDMMKEYAKRERIPVGRASAPATLAERIYNHYNPGE